MDIEDERRFREFVGARSKALVQTAYLLTGDWEHSRDLVQGALASLARRWTQLADPERAEAYTRKAIYHAHVDRTRRLSWRRERTTAAVPDRPAPDADPADAIANRAELMTALRQLPPGQRAVVVLRYFEDRSDADIAEVLGISTGTVRSQHHKALKALRVTVSPDSEDAADSAGTPDFAGPARPAKRTKPKNETEAA